MYMASMYINFKRPFGNMSVLELQQDFSHIHSIYKFNISLNLYMKYIAVYIGVTLGGYEPNRAYMTQEF